MSLTRAGRCHAKDYATNADLPNHSVISVDKETCVIAFSRTSTQCIAIDTARAGATMLFLGGHDLELALEENGVLKPHEVNGQLMKNFSLSAYNKIFTEIVYVIIRRGGLLHASGYQGDLYRNSVPVHCNISQHETNISNFTLQTYAHNFLVACHHQKFWSRLSPSSQFRCSRSHSVPVGLSVTFLLSPFKRL